MSGIEQNAVNMFNWEMKKIQYMDILILRFSYTTYRVEICQDRRDFFVRR